MELKCEFLARRNDESNRHTVWLKQWYEHDYRGEIVTQPADSYQGEHGRPVGRITEHETGIFTAEYHTSHEEHGRRIGYMEKIDGHFATIEGAVKAVEEHYDESKDNLMASP